MMGCPLDNVQVEMEMIKMALDRHEGSWVWRVVGQPQDCPPPTSALLLQANDDALQDYVCCWVTLYALHKFT